MHKRGTALRFHSGDRDAFRKMFASAPLAKDKDGLWQSLGDVLDRVRRH